MYRKLWITLAVVVFTAFTILGIAGYKGIQSAPPIPSKVLTTNGVLLFTGEEIRDGQNVWQSLGGQEIGSIWGHGAYVAPDWTADYLHRELTIVLDRWGWQSASLEQQAALRARLQEMMRKNTYDPATGVITVTLDRAAAFESLNWYYADVFATGRPEYAIAKNTLVDREKARKMTAFFWWTAWASATNRPDSNITYTQNWPHEPLIDLRPSSAAVLWSIVSVILLIAGVGALVWFYASKREAHDVADIPPTDPLLGAVPTPSQRATI